MADFTNPKYYTNRELSWLRFNERVLSEAKDASLPFMERLKFLAITSSNLDEFFMVRVASLKDMVHAGYEKKDIAGMTPKQQLAALADALHDFVKEQYRICKDLEQGLYENGIRLIRHHEDLSFEQAEYVDKFFEEKVYPVLTPMAVDSSRPFPLIQNKTLNIGAILSKKGQEKDTDFATVQVPGVLPRLVSLGEENGLQLYIGLEEVIERNIAKLFLNYDVLCSAPYRVMRNADLSIEEEEAEDLLKEIEKQIRKRQWGEAIRLEIEEAADRQLLKILKKNLGVSGEDIYEVPGPLDLSIMMKMYGLPGHDDLKKKPYIPCQVPRLPAGCNIFEEVAKGDVLLSHPYETFDPVVQFIEQAATDPKVLAIKQTLYRVSGNSPIIKALTKAAENGKQVSVLVELKARFDEEHNIVWARMLEQAGCHVIYGLVGLKTHSKITLVVRAEEDGIKRYVHLGTGNYNDATAKLYTDLGLLTCNESIGQDATAVFNMLSGYSEPAGWNKLSVAPLWLKKKLLRLIRREEEHARGGRSAKIIAKMNSLCDPDVIAALYAASEAGVVIKLLVRGICCLKAGLPGVSENIHVRSIVGDYLEHSRIFYFENDMQPEIFLASADWMPRNLERRVELMFPIEDPALREEIIHILDVQFKDNVKSHILQPDGSYKKEEVTGERICCQEIFCEEARAQVKSQKKGKSRVFIPKTHIGQEE
ncbi:MAG: RNA degradosome polyphosphate kinase [Lachnospiraceae bacterium]|nr:RNA degradosome polyphosphate kinase [Lachnospiraceae bacterium]